MRPTICIAILLVAIASLALAAQTTPQPAPQAQDISLDGHRALVVETIVPAPPEAVWPVWTSAEGFREVFDRPLDIELRPGGKYEIQWAPNAPEGERGTEGCRVLSFVPQRMLSFEWNAPPSLPSRDAFADLPVRPRFVVVTLDPIDDGATRMTVRHFGWEAGDQEHAEQEFQYFSRAWPGVSAHIRNHFASNRAAPSN